MELQFRKSCCSCLKPVLREVQNQEQTQEIKLPEGMPDIGRVLAAWGQVVLRGKEWNGDRVGMSAGVLVWVLYAPEDGTQPRCIDSWIPFQLRWDIPGNAEEGTMRTSCLLRFVDARSVSARKLMVRTGIGAMAEGFSPMETDVYIPENIPEDVALLRNRYPVRLPREAGEKQFAIDEDLSVPPSVPQPEKILYYSVHPRITDQKVLGNKTVFRGNMNLHVLYISEEGILCNWDFELPYSQFSELKGSYSSDAQVDMVLSPTSLEIKLDDEGQLRVKLGAVAQYVVDDPEMIELVEDAYSPGREVEVHSELLSIPALLETRRENIYGEQSVSEGADMVADVQFLPDYPRQSRTENGINMLLSGTFQVLYYAEDGSLQSANVRWEDNYGIPADMDSSFSVQPLSASAQATLGNGNMLVKGELPLQLTTTGTQGMHMVTGIQLGELRKADENRPSLILRRTGSDRLWDIAKENGSTMDAIRIANGLQEDPAPGQMLLIPVL